MKKVPQYQNLFNHPHILYKYFPLNNDYARRYKDDPMLAAGEIDQSAPSYISQSQPI